MKTYFGAFNDVPQRIHAIAREQAQQGIELGGLGCPRLVERLPLLSQNALSKGGKRKGNALTQSFVVISAIPRTDFFKADCLDPM